MRAWLRDLFLGDWRNKLVALFFAVSIWFVAFQHETDTYTASFTLSLVPENPEAMVILGAQVADAAEGSRPFSEPVQVTFSGTRKQIDSLRENLRRRLTLRVRSGEEVHVFSDRDLESLGPGFGQGVTVTKFEPPSVRVVQEPIETKEFAGISDLILVSQYEEESELKKEVLSSEWTSVRVRGPQSVLKRVSVAIPLALGYQRKPVEGRFALQVNPSDDELVQRTVQIYNFDAKAWVGVASSPRVPLRVTAVANEESFSHPAVRVSFRLPVIEGAYRVKLGEATSDRIPVEFRGPKADIARLKQAVQQVDFSLGVPPPPNFDPRRGGTFTFTEDVLELAGYPNVRILQHESRRRELKTAWSYAVQVIEGKEGQGSE